MDSADNRWRVEVMTAERPPAFDPASCKKVLTAGEIDAEGIKDSYALVIGGRIYLILKLCA